MSSNPFFSVIIPTHNRAHVLGRAIDSVLSQSFQNFELIVIDDGSTDNTDEILLKYTNKIHITKIENSGVSAARNRGVDLANGQWICFLDSDDEWLSHKLQSQYDFIQSNPLIPVIHGEEIWIRNGKRVNPKKKHKKSGGDIFEKCLPLCLISPSAVCIKKEIYLAMGGFDEDFIVCEDYDLWLKLTSLYPVGFIEEPIINKYGGHEDQLSARYKAMDLWRVKSMMRILKIRELSPSQQTSCINEIKNKANILRIGYEKHGRYDELQQLNKLVKSVLS